MSEETSFLHSFRLAKMNPTRSLHWAPQHVIRAAGNLVTRPFAALRLRSADIWPEGTFPTSVLLAISTEKPTEDYAQSCFVILTHSPPATQREFQVIPPLNPQDPPLYLHTCPIYVEPHPSLVPPSDRGSAKLTKEEAVSNLGSDGRWKSKFRFSDCDKTRLMQAISSDFEKVTAFQQEKRAANSSGGQESGRGTWSARSRSELKERKIYQIYEHDILESFPSHAEYKLTAPRELAFFKQ
jgi:hypothetical protein